MFRMRLSTLLEHPDGVLATAASDPWCSLDLPTHANPHPHTVNTVFIDRDPRRFKYICHFYRDGKILLPMDSSHGGIGVCELLEEGRYFGLPITVDTIAYQAPSSPLGIAMMLTAEEMRDQALVTSSLHSDGAGMSASGRNTQLFLECLLVNRVVELAAARCGADNNTLRARCMDTNADTGTCTGTGTVGLRKGKCAHELGA